MSTTIHFKDSDVVRRLYEVLRYHAEDILNVGFYESKKTRETLRYFIRVTIACLIQHILDQESNPIPSHGVGVDVYVELMQSGIYEKYDVSLFSIVAALDELLECQDYIEFRRSLLTLSRKYELMAYTPDDIVISNSGRLLLIYD